AAKFDLTLVMEAQADGLIGWVEYVTELFDAATIARLCDHLHTVLAHIVTDLDTPIGHLPLLTPAEMQQLVVDWNQTSQSYALDVCLPQVFEAQVRRTPDAIALICEGEALSYDALNRRANRLARQLVARGIGPETLVGLFAERGFDFITAMLAIFKAGGAFVPLDPRHPAQRIAQVLEHSGCACVLVSPELESLLQEAAAALPADHALDCVSLPSLIAQPAAEDNLVPRCIPDNLAYLMFTSGSTGRPKGVMVEHLGMLNHIYAKIADVQLTPADRVAQTGPQTFDIVVWQCLASLLIGGEIVIYNDEVTYSPAQLLTRLDEDRIAVLQVVPSLMRALLGEIDARGPHKPDLAALRWLVPTGDALPTELCRQWFDVYPNIPVLNTYGSTECSDDQCHYPISAVTPGDAPLPIMPIGRPIANMQAYVLDSRLSPVPIGVVGELYVGGVGVGRGYLDDPARTAAVFVPDPFAAQTQTRPGARLYKTSDQARVLADGRIEFLGRNDHLIKLRGFRIEPGDIESVLKQHPAVHDTVVVVRSDGSSEKQLVAYVVPDLHHAAALDAETGSDLASSQVESWEAVFDEVYSAHEQSAHDAGLNLRVWTSSYTGAPLPEAEIFEAVEDTVSRILALRPRRVLELGCGTGLILFRIAPHCEHYCGTELSQAALRRLEARLATEPELQAKVSLQHGAADELDQVAEQPFDLIIVNETVQYFPSGDYLRQVLDKAIAALAPGGAIFLGGLRSLPQLESFHTSVQLYQAPADFTIAALRQRIRRQLVQEKELVVDPALFAALAEQDDRLSQVQIQLKGGWQHNEFTRFRYDAILQVRGRDAQPSTPEWSDWRGWNIDRLHERLANERPALLALARVPNARLQPELAAQALLETAEPQTTVGALRDSIAQTHAEGIDPQALWELGQATGYVTLISWSDAAAPGCFDVIFARGTDTPAISNMRSAAAPARQVYTNNPLFGKFDQQLPPVLQAFLGERLPAYMVPSTVVLLDALPLNANGKVDRPALPAPDAANARATRQYVAPRTAYEQTLAEIWGQLLGVEQIGVDDSFFELGGHSLLATGVTARVRDRFQVELPLRVIFESPTLARLAARIEQLHAEQQQAADDQLLRLLEQVEALTDQEAQQRLKPPADSQEERS
ncbi:MAG: amino acid adenylation domain-containing protein, partial [Chloroflexi bacterium]|nr:amino acid adenylation domain-containing protein [Chloroflexota bacterium]